MTALLEAALIGAALLAQDADPAVIKIGPTTITASEAKARATEARARGAQFDVKRFIDYTVAECVLALDARRGPVGADPNTLSTMSRERDRILAAALTERSIAPLSRPSEAKLKELFHQSSDAVRIRAIVVATREEAQSIKDRLASGGDFALESSRSLDPAAVARKGAPVLITRSEMDPALAKAAFSEPTGRLIGPIEQKVGWAVATVTEKVLADERAFAEQRPALEGFVRNQDVAAARRHYVEQRRKQLGVSIDDAFLSSLGTRVEISAAEAEKPLAILGGKPILYREVVPLIRSLAASGEGSHTSGPVVKKRVLNDFLDNRILALDAATAKIDRIPEVQAAVARAESMALAIAEANAIMRGAAGKPAERQKAIDRRVQELRREYKVWVDERAVAAAISGQP